MKNFSSLLVLATLAAGGVASIAPASAEGGTRPTPAARVSTAGAATAAAGRTPPAPRDSAMVLHGDREGTAFKSLTVEGEDRVHLEIGRPELSLDLDPLSAPGLELGGGRDVLARTSPDWSAPLLGASAHCPSPYVGRPWLEQFASGAVARFHPAVERAERWRLVIADSRGQSVAGFEGRGEPPAEIAWDGRSKSGASVVPGLTYSYVFEAHDRAGNKRSFVGEPFKVSAYRLEGSEGPILVFSGAELDASPAGLAASREIGDEPSGAAILLEAASWLNQSAPSRQPIKVIAVARSFERSSALAERVASRLAALTLGDPMRIQSVAQVEPDAPESGMVRIAAER
jgi:hypothetical protein